MEPEKVERWRELLAWLDGWFEPDKAAAHNFDRPRTQPSDRLAPSPMTGSHT